SLSRLTPTASSIQHGRSAALTSSLAALPASLGLLRPVSATGGGLRAPPFCEKGAFWEVELSHEAAPSKSLLFPEGKRGVRRPPPVAETGRSKPSETGNIASALCARSEATMLNCGTVARRKP